MYLLHTSLIQPTVGIVIPPRTINLISLNTALRSPTIRPRHNTPITAILGIEQSDLTSRVDTTLLNGFERSAPGQRRAFATGAAQDDVDSCAGGCWVEIRGAL